MSHSQEHKSLDSKGPIPLCPEGQQQFASLSLIQVLKIELTLKYIK